MSLQEIVNVQITQETASIEQAGFSVALILGPNANLATRVQEFAAADSELADALSGGTAAPEYLAALALKSQIPCPPTFKIGSIGAVKILTDDGGTYTAGDIVLKLNGITITESFDTDKDTTMAALAATIQSYGAVATAVYAAGAHTITITPNATSFVGITDIDLTDITGTMDAITITNGAIVEAYSTALANIVEADPDWYGLCAITRTNADQRSIAAWVEANNRFYITASSESDIINFTDDLDASSIAHYFKSYAYARSTVIYSANAATQYPDAALLGKLLPLTAGSFTAKFKTLAGVSADILSYTKSSNARSKNANTNETIGGKNIIAEGTVGEGEFIDIIMFIDWLKARIQEEIYGVFVKNSKVPYTPTGLVSISSAIEQVLRVGQANGGISEYLQDDDGNQNGGFIVTLPNYNTISAVDKANRELNNVKFTAWLSGAIHAVAVNGVVTY